MGILYISSTEHSYMWNRLDTCVHRIIGIPISRFLFRNFMNNEIISAARTIMFGCTTLMQ